MGSVLGLDCSSTAIGWCHLVDGEPRQYGTLALGTGDIAGRCCRALREVGALLDALRPVLTVIESPVGRFAGSVIPQARVSGAVLIAIGDRGLLYIEAAPSEAKHALAGDGGASKAQMLLAAAPRIGIVPAGLEVKNKKKALLAAGADGKIRRVMGEDEADALGLALHAAGLTIVAGAPAARRRAG